MFEQAQFSWILRVKCSCLTLTNEISLSFLVRVVHSRFCSNEPGLAGVKKMFLFCLLIVTDKGGYLIFTDKQ